MRFVGQAFEVGVELPASRLGSLDAAYLAELFADAHHRTFMHGATLPIGTPPRLDRETLTARGPEKTKIFHGEAWIDCARHTAEALTAGQKIDGPAVIEGYTATTWVPPGWTAELDAADNLILRRTP
jgi:N-methylhydantoinase A